MKIVDYEVVDQESVYGLEQAVKAKLAEGWHLHGDLYINRDRTAFLQPMVKYGEVESVINVTVEAGKTIPTSDIVNSVSRVGARAFRRNN